MVPDLLGFLRLTTDREVGGQEGERENKVSGDSGGKTFTDRKGVASLKSKETRKTNLTRKRSRPKSVRKEVLRSRLYRGGSSPEETGGKQRKEYWALI